MKKQLALDTNQFAEMFFVERSTAYGLLRFLADKGLVNTTQRPMPAGRRGKPTTIFLLDLDSLPALLGELLIQKYEENKAMMPAVEQPVAQNEVEAKVVV